MLAAEANAIAHEAMHGSLSILEREMNVVLMYMSNVGTQASLFAGFVFVAFYEPLFNNNPDAHPVASVFGMVMATVSFSAMVYTVVCSTISSSLGPTLALKGSDTSSMRKAVEYMKLDR